MDREEEKRYSINGKTYVQRQLVLGQINQLLSVLNDIPITNITPQSILISLGAKIPAALAVLLIPEESTVKDRDLKAIEDDMFFCPADVILEILDDFLSLNPISSFQDKLKNFKTLLVKEITGIQPGKSSDSSTRSQAETYLRENLLSGL
ncbi:MAG: hypothetical protein AB1847_22535 [bacterium]